MISTTFDVVLLLHSSALDPISVHQVLLYQIYGSYINGHSLVSNIPTFKTQPNLKIYPRCAVKFHGFEMNDWTSG